MKASGTSGRPMRVLIAHNLYRSDVPSGENRVVGDLAAALEEGGTEVFRFFRSSDEISEYSLPQKFLLPIKPLHSLSVDSEFRSVLSRWKPDVVHVHNVYPLLSPAVIRSARRRGIPVMHFVHNYRHLCLQGTMIRDDHPCTLCVEANSNLPAIRYGCYRGSRAQTAVLALSEQIHRGTWREVDGYVAVSGFVKEQLVRGGFPGARIAVVPNLTRDPGPADPPTNRRFLFAGRLDFSKGVKLLLEAWKLAALGEDWTLTIAGSGVLAGLVQDACRGSAGIEYLGQMDRANLAAAYQSSVAVVAPSLCHETFGLTAIEGFAHGRAVIATRMGGLPEVVAEDCGWLVDPSPLALAAKLNETADDWDGLLARGLAGRRRYEALYAPACVVSKLFAAQAELLSNRRP